MARILYIEIYILQCAYINGSKFFEEKVSGKVGECIFDS